MILMAYLSYMLAEVRYSLEIESILYYNIVTDSTTDRFYYFFGSYFLLVPF